MPDARSEITNAFKFLGAATVLLFVVLGSLGAFVFIDARRDRERQGDVIRLLCNRSYNLAPIVDDVVLGSIALYQQRLQAHREAGDAKAVNADLEILFVLQDGHVRLQDQLLTTGTPCEKVP